MKHKSSLITIILFLIGFFLNSNIHTQAQQVNVTLQVDMSYQTVSEFGVHVAGSFQGWVPSATELTDDNGDGIYAITIAFEQDSVYEYKFINGNDWIGAEDVYGDCAVNNENTNRSLNVGDSDFSTESYYFSSCNYSVPAQLGCTDNGACNYNSAATIEDSTCVYAQDGYDCNGNLLSYLGTEAEGGIVFYYDSIGDFGLVPGRITNTYHSLPCP